MLWRMAARAGWVSGSCWALGTIPTPRGPSTLQFTAPGWIQTTKNRSSSRGARAKCPSETCLQNCNYNQPLHPRSYFRVVMDSPVPIQGHTLPVCQERCSHTAFALHCVHEGSCATCPPLSSGTPRAALSLLASPTALSHRAELSQGRGTDRISPLAQQMHAVVLS